MSKSKPARANIAGRHGQMVKPNAVVSQSETITYSSGPIPNPETLAKYNEIHPDLAQDIITSFKAEYAQRHRMQTISMEGDIEAMRLSHADAKRGQWLGFMICILGLTGGISLVFLGHDTAGTILGAAGLASVVTAFYMGNRNPKASN